jgi:hypothetical protein
MGKWDEKIIQRQIDEVIVESYLLCLNEEEVRLYLKRFLKTCETALGGSADNLSETKLAGVRVAMMKAYLLLGADSRAVRHPVYENRGHSHHCPDEHQFFVEKVVSCRSAIVRLLNAYDPGLSLDVREDPEPQSAPVTSLPVTSLSAVEHSSGLIFACAGIGLIAAALAITVWALIR